jgi:hypothetical protein
MKRWTASAMGKKGGKTTGQAKVRGDSAYYKRLRQIRKEKETALAKTTK